MSNVASRKLWIGAVVALLVGTLYVRSGDDGQDTREVSDEPGSDPALLLDRLWLDSKPEKYTDYTHVMFAVSYAPIGIFQKASSYQATAELYEFKRRDGRLSIHFPQTGSRHEVTYKIRTCDELPPFDLCMDLSENPWGGPRRYYALADQDQEAARFGELRHQLEHRLPAR